MSIEAVIVGDEEVRARFHRAAGEIDGKLADSMGRITIRLQAHVVRNKLSGQVLNVRTNNLRGSIHQEVIRDGSGIVGSVPMSKTQHFMNMGSTGRKAFVSTCGQLRWRLGKCSKNRRRS